ncbi:Transposase, IS5 family [Methanocella conradii HZ254]|uniref:Transposase, IS5 family n=1 Tax=Methanocella conradii (strain DSM 24694 / JCM 17849 / CGMCC 1.5162 / HZ254) TaxID=1041930 RepID=H8I6U1_METCZ|nr:IS5 family transposase [Methanocella conradii]AFC99411.1 Transposase, IS5 family [Methanocella conradii HZ254]
MSYLYNQGFKQYYDEFLRQDDRLDLVKQVIDWEAFRPIIARVFDDGPGKAGRPHNDEVVMFRCLVLQAWYGLSDPGLEQQLKTNICFMNFVGFDARIPDYSTVWRFRERLARTGLFADLWTELQRQLKTRGLVVREGVIQDATFIESDTGRKRMSEEKKKKENQEPIIYTEKQLSHMDDHGTFTVKNGRVFHGDRLHVLMDSKSQLIVEFETSTASLHDSRVSLVREGDMYVFRDKGYAGCHDLPVGTVDYTLHKMARNKPLNEYQAVENRLISGIRALVERPFSVIKRVFHNGRTRRKRSHRVHAENFFRCLDYNLYQLVTIKKKKHG